MVIRTRFAPSPTGFLHVGGARTALFAWLYAKKHQGEFVLRIEDTDLERSTEASVQAILDGMEWLGLTHDVGPIYQSHRFERYAEVAAQLLENGNAYRCTCSKERLTLLREKQIEAKQKPRYDGQCRHLSLAGDAQDFVVRFKTPESGQITFHDQVYGEITVNNSELDDVILLRSDGVPTYNFTVVIDDSDMGISHVIRGDDHINNTPRQINIMQALNLPIPTYAHLPMILGEDGKRLSKRHGAVSVMQYADEGYLPEALLNYLVRLGWSHGDQEIFSVAEMTSLFDLAHVQRGGAAFNTDKLQWLNAHHMKQAPLASIADLLAARLNDMGLAVEQGPNVIDVVTLLIERSHTLVDLAEQAKLFYVAEINYDETAVAKQLKPVIKPALQSLHDCLAGLSEWRKETIHEALTRSGELHELKFGKIAQPFRVAITGGTKSPSIADTAALMSQATVLARVEHAIMLIAD